MLPASHGIGSGVHRLARNFSATVSEVSFGETMSSTINGYQLLILPGWGRKALRNSQKEKAKASTVCLLEGRHCSKHLSVPGELKTVREVEIEA